MQGRDLQYWLELLIRRRSIALQVGAAVFGLILLGTLLWPPVYQSTAKILVQDNRAQYLVSPDLQGSSAEKQAIVANPITQADLNSEIELLTSTYLIKDALSGLPAPVKYAGPGSNILKALHVAMDLPAIGYDSLHSAPELTGRDEWALKLEQHIASSAIKQSNMIEVSFNSRDPKWSRDFLSRLLNEYLVYHAHISHDPQAERFFEQQANILRARLDASEDKLRQFEVQTGVTDVSAQKQELVKQLSDLELQNGRVQAALASANQRVVSIQTEMKTTPQQIGKEMRSVQNMALQQLKPQVMQLKAERAELLSRYQPTSQRIKEIDAKIAAAQTILNREDHLEVQEKSVALNPIWVTLDTGLESSRANAAADQAMLKTLSSQIEALRGQINQMSTNAIAFERLKRQVDTDREAYMSYVRKTEEARTAQALNLNKILNVSIAQPPLLPLRPVFPKVWLNLGAGMVLALLLGGLAAWWEESRDDRIFSPVTVAEVSGLSTVAILRDEA
jgi:uncharacterized protein involved in exopolysaccharide biosynthesis